jgi:molybdopterin-binding protein
MVRSISGSDLKEFSSGGMNILCLTDVPEGDAFLMIRPDEISISYAVDTSSSRNKFKGTITDIIPAKLGLEVTVDVGVEMVVMISSDALKSLKFEVGKDVWISFKASSCRVYA